MISGAVQNNPNGAVEGLYQDYQGIVSELSSVSPSGLAAVNRSYHKHLLVAAASSLEEQVKKVVKETFERHGTVFIGTFISKAVMARGYHGLFDWNGLKASSFFSNFGPECSDHFKAQLKGDDSLRRQHDSFMQLGAQRNNVVHNDYATYSIDLTPDEVMAHYRNACAFVERMEDLILQGVGQQELSE